MAIPAPSWFGAYGANIGVQTGGEERSVLIRNEGPGAERQVQFTGSGFRVTEAQPYIGKYVFVPGKCAAGVTPAYRAQSRGLVVGNLTLWAGLPDNTVLTKELLKQVPGQDPAAIDAIPDYPNSKTTYEGQVIWLPYIDAEGYHVRPPGVSQYNTLNLGQYKKLRELVAGALRGLGDLPACEGFYRQTVGTEIVDRFGYPPIGYSLYSAYECQDLGICGVGGPASQDPRDYADGEDWVNRRRQLEIENPVLERWVTPLELPGSAGSVVREVAQVNAVYEDTVKLTPEQQFALALQSRADSDPEFRMQLGAEVARQWMAAQEPPPPVVMTPGIAETPTPPPAYEVDRSFERLPVRAISDNFVSASVAPPIVLSSERSNGMLLAVAAGIVLFLALRG